VRLMIAGMLPYLQWKFGADDKKKGYIAKWFKPATCTQAANAYWDPKEECVKNTSDKLLDVMNVDSDDLYWVVNQVPPSPKQKQTQVENKSMNDLVLMVKTAVSQKTKQPKSALKPTATTMEQMPLPVLMIPTL